MDAWEHLESKSFISKDMSNTNESEAIKTTLSCGLFLVLRQLQPYVVCILAMAAGNLIKLFQRKCSFCMHVLLQCLGIDSAQPLAI